MAFFPPTDFLSMDGFAAANNLPMDEEIYPFDSPMSLVGFLVQCPGEGPAKAHPTPAPLSASKSARTRPRKPIQPATSTVPKSQSGRSTVSPTQVPFNQSQLVYNATIAEVNEARFTLVPSAGHEVEDIIDAEEATTWETNAARHETETVGAGPSWDEIEDFMRATLERAR